MKHRALVIVVCLAWIVGCQETPPTVRDGSANLVIVAFWDSLGNEAAPAYVPMPNAKVIVSSEYGMVVRYADSRGIVELQNLPITTYGITARIAHPSDPSIVLTGTLRGVVVSPSTTLFDTIYAKPISSSGISINEIYTAGPVNSFFYFYDLYLELYNASDEVKYLDGMMIMRVTGELAGADVDNDGDMDGNTKTIYKFPGSPGEKKYPIQPKQFIVLASDAVDHTKTVATSYDLSTADWEFYNQFSPADIDNPNVKNLINMRSDVTTDFLLGLSDDVLVLSSGVDSTWADGIDISTIIDGVEYQSSSSQKKTLDSRIDRSYVLSAAKYSGKSIQRREPGLDSNDGLIDFEILPRATPGKQ